MEENTEQRIDLTLFSEKIQGLKERIASVIVGQEQTVDSGKRSCADRRCAGSSENVAGPSHGPVD